jgi:3-oxoacyl-[acyl-carrier-protein] synthase II
MKPIAILDWKSMVPGNLSWNDLADGKSSLTTDPQLAVVTGSISKSNQDIIAGLKKQHKNYKHLDRSTLLALATVDQFADLPPNVGVNFGSSRGATQLTEESISEFIKEGTVPTTTSPNTTLGNLSSWVGNHIGNKGINLSHSITCSTGLHAILNGAAWLHANMATHMLCGASEAPLTKYTVAQMQSLKIYSSLQDTFACQSMVWDKAKNTMVLGEAAACFLLSAAEKSQYHITGIGWGAEPVSHPANLSESADCLKSSMQMALQNANLAKVDAIVMHAPGTVKGDVAELNAITQVFGKNTPALTSNKWAFGHTFATSGLLNLDMALHMLTKQQWIPNPLQTYEAPNKLENILINAVGFGGNAVSLVVSLSKK